MRADRKWAILTAFLLFPTIYILPFLLTYMHIPFSPVPLGFSSDIYMYLNYTQLQIGTDGMAQNPWYHTDVPTSELVYLKFGLLNLFAWLNDLFGNLALTLIIWNWLWAAATFLCAFFLFEKLSSDTKDYIVTLFGIALLFFFQISDAPMYFKGILHLSFDPDVLLPLQRTFFPQMATPLLFLYLYLLVEAFQKRKSLYWILLFLVQYVAFINFPYNTILMGTVTFFAILFALVAKESLPWKHLAIFAVAVIAADLVFLMDGAASGSSHRQIFDIDPSRLYEIFGGTNIVLLLLTTIVFFLPDPRKFVKYTIAALGASQLLLQMSDIVFNPALQLTHHFAYFVQKVIAILLFYIVVNLGRPIRTKTWLRVGTAAATLLLTTFGVLSAQAQADAALSHHRENFQIYSTLKRLELSEDDLVIAPSVTVNDIATWLPLLFKSEVLFSRNSEFLLPNSKEGRDLYWQREALYLHLVGFDAEKLHETLLGAESNDSDIMKIILVGQRFDLFTARREKLLKSTYEKIGRYLNRLENDPDSFREFLANYKRVILIDHIDQPIFNNFHRLGTPSAVERSNGIFIRIYTLS